MQLNNQNILELSTIMSSKENVLSAYEYEEETVSNLINKNITQFLSVYHPGDFFTKIKSNFHFFENNFYLKNNNDQSLQEISLNDNTRNQHVKVSKISATIVLEQIINNNIGFNFLTNEEIIVFLLPLMASIDKSYNYFTKERLMDEFSRLIIAQTVHALRTCTARQEDIQRYTPCLIISTLFLRPPPLNVFTHIVYNFYPLPIVVNHHQYTYSNIPTTFGVNFIDHTLISWNNQQEKSNCFFSKIVQCREHPIIISLSSVPCISKLFSTDKSISNACGITRSLYSLSSIVNVVQNIWIFYNLDEVNPCQIYSHSNDSNKFLSISEPSIMHLSCGTSIKCSDAHLSTSICKENTIAVKTETDQFCTNLSNIQFSISKLTTRLENAFKSKARDSFRELQMDFDNNRSSTVKIFQIFADLLVYFLLLLLFIIMIAILKFIKINIQKKMNQIEKDMNKFSDVFSLDVCSL
jgi:hypothetical protein